MCTVNIKHCCCYLISTWKYIIQTLNSAPQDCSLGTGSFATVTFAAGSTRQCIDVGITNDNLKEDLEICQLTASMAPGSILGIEPTQSSSDICITDDDRESVYTSINVTADC